MHSNRRHEKREIAQATDFAARSRNNGAAVRERPCRFLSTMHSDKKPTVFVLLPVHNRRRVTRKFMDSLEAQTYQPLQLVVMDDGSTDGTAAMIKELRPDTEIVRGDGSWWWSGCMQRGYQWLLRHSPNRDDIVLIANDDIIFASNFIEKAVAALIDEQGALLGAQFQDPASGRVRESGVNADLRRFRFCAAESAQQINCLPTRALLLRWADMRRIGGFHPLLLPHYWADYEYTLRAFRLGIRCVTRPDVFVTANMETTGYHDLDGLVGWRFLRRLFSVKTPLNPLYRTSFVVVASPWAWKAVNVANVWLRAGFRILWQGILHQPFPRKTVSGFSA